MTRSRSISAPVSLWLLAATVALGCSSSNPTTGEESTGGSGGSGTGGALGSGGSGGTTSSGAGGPSSTGGSGGSGGSATGVGGAAAGTGGAPAGGVAGSGAGGMMHAGNGGAAPGGGAGTSSGAGMAGASVGGRGGAGFGGRAGSAGMAGAGVAGAPMAGGGGMSGGGSGMSAGCGKMPTISSSMINNGQHISIMAANMQRRFILNVPSNYDNTHPYRLVIAYHELNGNDDEMYRNKYYHLLPLSNDTTIFVAPNGQKNGSSCSDASGCGWPNPNNSDLQLADAIVAELEDNYCIDTNRIFATGWSYGGSMSYKTACERPLGGVTNGFVRAIAVYSGSQLSGNCTPQKPVAYFASHGTHDSVLNYSNGVGLAQNFAKANGCTWATPTQVTSGPHMCTNEMGCNAGYPVEFCSFNGDHTPDPDNGQSGSSWVYQQVWDFFSQF